MVADTSGHSASRHRSPVVTEKALPSPVLEAAKNGAKLKWGLVYDDKRKNKLLRLKKLRCNLKSLKPIFPMLELSLTYRLLKKEIHVCSLISA